MDQQSLYYIVEFFDGMQLIPYNWLNTSKTKAYWPSFTNIKKYDKAVQYMEPVGENWIICDILRILGSAQSFESGKKKLKLAEIHSDLNTDISDNEKLKKDRKIRAAKKYDSETDSDLETAESILAPFPKLHSYKAIKTKKTIQNSACINALSINTIQPSCSKSIDTTQPSCSKSIPSESPVISASESSNLIKTRKRDEVEKALKNKRIKTDDTEQDFQENFKENIQGCILTGEKEFQRFMVKNMIETKFALKRCENILANILNKNTDVSQKEEHSTFTKHTLDEFPIVDLETMQNIEHQLKTNESYKHSVIKMLSIVGGHDLKSITLNILTRTLTNAVATKYSWLGGKKKLIFSNLHLWKIILNVVRRHIPNAIESDISKYIKIWLAHATERLQREERKNKKEDVEQTIHVDTIIEQTPLQMALEKDILLA